MAKAINTKTLELIQNFEQRRLKAYHGAADPDGVYTIGWGHVITGREIPDLFQPGDFMRDVAITEARAEELFVEDLSKFASGVQMRLNKDQAAILTDDQFGALVSLSYNIGLGNFGISQVKQQINAGNVAEAVDGFSHFIKANGVPVNGLIRRRAAEAALYKSEYDPMTYFLENSNPTAIAKARQYLNI